MDELQTNIVIGPVRFSYAFVFKPFRNEDGKEKYSVQLLIDKKDKVTLKKIKMAIQNAIEKGSAKLEGKIKGLKLPLHDGDEERDDEVYEGKYFLTASSDYPPGIVGPDKEKILDQREFYSGCYGYAEINFYPFNVKNKGIAVGLNNIMKTKDGDPLGGSKQSAEKAFKDIEVEEDEDEDDIFSELL